MSTRSSEAPVFFLLSRGGGASPWAAISFLVEAWADLSFDIARPMQPELHRQMCTWHQLVAAGVSDGTWFEKGPASRALTRQPRHRLLRSRDQAAWRLAEKSGSRIRDGRGANAGGGSIAQPEQQPPDKKGQSMRHRLAGDRQRHKPSRLWDACGPPCVSPLPALLLKMASGLFNIYPLAQTTFLPHCHRPDRRHPANPE